MQAHDCKLSLVVQPAPDELVHSMENGNEKEDARLSRSPWRERSCPQSAQGAQGSEDAQDEEGREEAEDVVITFHRFKGCPVVRCGIPFCAQV